MELAAGQRGSGVLSWEEKLMGTECLVIGQGDDEYRVREAIKAAFWRMGELEEQLSLFRSDSELCLVNRLAAERPVALSPELYYLLDLAREVYVDTGGAFDVTVGPLLRLWGFRGGNPGLPGHTEVRSAMAVVGFDKLVVDPEARTVEYRVPGLELDLGGIGKGYAADCAAELLKRYGVSRGAVAFGQSSLRLLDPLPGETSWRVRVRGRDGGGVLELDLDNVAVATSGNYERFVEREGKVYGHVIDPRNGHPVETCFSVTVLAGSAALADALSTALLVMGYEPARDWLERHREIKAVIVRESDSGKDLVVDRFNFN